MNRKEESGKALEKNEKKRTRTACCDIFHDEKQVTLNLEMPGVSRESLDVRIDGNLLIITGSKKLPSLKGDFLIREIRDEDYHQEFTLDDTIDREKIQAVVKQGLVTLELQKKESVLPRRITIN